jgi:hypothetical protein
VSPPEPLDAALHRLAGHLGSLRERVVFVGGAIRGLLMSDPAAPEARPTDDIDVIVEVASYGEYHDEIERHLHEHGFGNDARPDAPLCRYVHGALTVDVMPTRGEVLGFTNRWYAHAIATANVVTLPGPPPIDIRVVSAASFVATKLEAFASRGKGDFLHHDLEDVIALVDGRRSLLRELTAEPVELREFVADAMHALFDRGLEEKVRWHLPSDGGGSAREPILRTRLRRLERLIALTESELVSCVAIDHDAATSETRRGWRAVAVTLRAAGDCDLRDMEIEADDGRRSRLAEPATSVLGARHRDESMMSRHVFHVTRDAEDLHLLLPRLGVEMMLDPR